MLEIKTEGLVITYEVNYCFIADSTNLMDINKIVEDSNTVFISLQFIKNSGIGSNS